MSVEAAPAPELSDWASLDLKLATLPEAALPERCRLICQTFADAADAAGAPLPPDVITGVFSMLLSHVAHKDDNAAVEACGALRNLATANIGCLASHPDVGHLFNLLCPFQPHRTRKMRLFEEALTTIFATLSTVDSVNARNALVANGLISVVMRFFVHHLAVTLPRERGKENSGAGPEGRPVALGREGREQHSAQPSEHSSVDSSTPFRPSTIATEAATETASFDHAAQMTRLLATLLQVQLPLSIVAPILPVLEQLMKPPEVDSNTVARYACVCAGNILRQSPQHRAAGEAIIVPRVFALVKHATAIVLRASVGAATGTAAVGGSRRNAPATAAVVVSGTTPVEATPQSRVDQVERQPPEYLAFALSFLTELNPPTDTNVVRTMLMLLASLRKLPPTPPVLSVIESALGFLLPCAHGPVEQRHAVIDGGMLNSVFDMLTYMGHGDPVAYRVACFALFHFVVAKPRKGEGGGFSSDASFDPTPIIRRILAAAFAYGPVSDKRVPVPLWNFANGVAGYPAELAAKQSQGIDDSVEERAADARMVILTIRDLMKFGLSDGSDFNGRGSGKACANPQSWWYALLHRMRALLKNSRDPTAVDLLQFCAAVAVVTAETNRGSKGRLR